ncbi:hypothetical protein AB4144_67225, partial [Rhizobiaceae sp. 2RAB30]
MRYGEGHRPLRLNDGFKTGQLMPQANPTPDLAGAMSAPEAEKLAALRRTKFIATAALVLCVTIF